MTTIAPREYDELAPGPSAPLSRLYHENSKLTDRRAAALREQMDRFATTPGEPALEAYPSRPVTALPRPGRRLFGARLDSALRARRSHRGPFPAAPLRLDHLGSLLGLAVGITSDPPDPRLRAFPSAGALHPIEVYLVAMACESLERGVHHYDVARHSLALVAPCPSREDLARLILADEQVEHAAAAVVLTGVFERTQAKYGERGYRFLLLEAGHAAQNLLLVATSMGVPALPVGGFCEDALGAAMGLESTKESPVYVILLGGKR